MIQYSFSLTERTHTAIEAAFSHARIKRYLPLTKGAPRRAVQYMLWNTQIGADFYGLIQIVEIVFRNSVVKEIEKRFGLHWDKSGSFLALLKDHHKKEISKIQKDLISNFGKEYDRSRLTASLSFGFWNHWLTKNAGGVLWAHHQKCAFPYAPAGLCLHDFHETMEAIRHFRNRVAHHRSLFDKKPTEMKDKILDVIGWICPDSRWLAEEFGRNISRTLNQRPR